MMMIERKRTSGGWVVGGRGYMVRIGRRHIVQFGAIVSGAVSLLLSLFLSFVIVVLKIVFHFSSSSFFVVDGDGDGDCWREMR